MLVKGGPDRDQAIAWISVDLLSISPLLMMTSSSGSTFRVTGPLCGEFTGPGEFPAQRPVTRSFDVFFHLRLNKRLSKQPRGGWFDTPPWWLWRQCNVKNKTPYLAFPCELKVIYVVNILVRHDCCNVTAVQYDVAVTAWFSVSLRWRHNGRDSVSNHQPHDCLLNRLFRRRSKKTSKFRATGLCAGNSPGTSEFPAHKWPVTRKMFPFDDVIMCRYSCSPVSSESVFSRSHLRFQG